MRGYPTKPFQQEPRHAGDRGSVVRIRALLAIAVLVGAAPTLAQPPRFRDVVLPYDASKAVSVPAPEPDRGSPPDDGRQVDLLVAYTPTARREMRGHGRIRTWIRSAVTATNRAFRDSGVRLRINLVGAIETRDDELNERAMPGQGSRILSGLIDPDDGYMDRVHAVRDRLTADLVHLIISPSLVERLNYCGEAKRWEDILPGPDSHWAHFAVTGSNCGTRTFVHETGHQFGVQHDRYVEVQQGLHDQRVRGKAGKALIDLPYPYAHGYTNPGQRWITVMAYPTECEDLGVRCEWLMRFSNPNQTYPADGGERLGVPGNRPSRSPDGPADARRTINQLRSRVANHRRAPCVRGGATVRLQASNGQYVVAEGNGGGAVVADRNTRGPWGRFTLVDHDGGRCVESGDVVSLHTSDGFYLRARRGGGSDLDATAPRATPWARFVVRRELEALNGGVRRGAVRLRSTISFRAHGGEYVGAVGGGGGAVNVTRSRAGAWERFRIVP